MATIFSKIPYEEDYVDMKLITIKMLRKVYHIIKKYSCI